MKGKGSRTAMQLFISVALTLAAAGAPCQTWPDRPLRVVVAFPAGGLADTLTRTLQPKLAEGLGQPLVIENRGGAGGTIAEALVAKSAPDGYTMMVGVDSAPANPHLFRNLQYDFFKDLAPVSLIARVPLVLLAHPSVPPNSLPEFIAYVRSRQGKVSYASPGNGTSNHLYMEMLKNEAGLEMIHVPYKGGAAAMTDLIGGQVQATLISLTLALPQIRTGKAKAIAITSEARTSSLPEVQTFAEAGYAGFTPHTWSGLFVPAGTPAPIVQRLHAEHAKAARSPEVMSRLRDLGAEVVASSPAEFSALLRTESERLGKLIREQRITAD